MLEKLKNIKFDHRKTGFRLKTLKSMHQYSFHRMKNWFQNGQWSGVKFRNLDDPEGYLGGVKLKHLKK